MEMKMELLKSVKTPLETLPSNSCCSVLPKIDSKEFEIVCTFLDYNLESPFAITKNLDCLLGKWLKIKKYIDLPDQQRLVAILFIQRIWINDFFKIHITSPHQASLRVVKPQIWANFDQMCYDAKVLKTYRSRQTSGLPIQMSINCRFPFVFAEISDCNLAFLTESDFDCSFGSKPMTILPTCNPRIYLLIFSSILRNEKDCAKLLRCFLKNPNHFVWTCKIQTWFSVELCINAKAGQILYTMFGIENDIGNFHYDEDLVNEQIDLLESMSEFEIDNDFILKTYLDGTKFNRRSS